MATKRVCDRCGATIKEVHPMSQIKFPKLFITKFISLGNTESIDLCDNCIEEFDLWLKGEQRCKHIHYDGVTCEKYPACDDCEENPSNKT